MDCRISTPFTKEKAAGLHIGDMVYLTGTIYTARDAAHNGSDQRRKTLAL